MIYLNSYWMEELPNLKNFEKVNKNYECDVLVIGAGLTGLTCGYYLSKQGLKVIIVEKDTIGLKASGHSTAKITYQHNLIYDYLIKNYGKKYAKAYLEANKQAIQNIKNIIDTEKIDCDFEYQSNYIYTTNQEELTKINAEVQALYSLGEPAEFVTQSPLPFKIAGAVLTKNQAQFHPIKYMIGLSDAIINNNSSIFCNSIATDFSKVEDDYISIVNGYKIKSKHIVVASHYPFKKFSRILFYKNVSVHILCYWC